MSVTFQRERLAGLWDEITPLLKEHWREIATYPDIPLDPDVERYTAVEASGWLTVFTAREDGELVGYAVFMVAGNMHYRSSRIGIADVVYIAPAHRRGGTGVALLRYADAQLAADGVQAVFHHQKVAHPALGKVLEHRGYEHVENIWAKRLDKGV